MVSAVRLWLALGCCCAVNANLSAEEPAWKAAAAKARITPEGSMWMAGYASRNKPSEGVTQGLFAKALVIADAAGGKLAVVTLDLIGVPRSLREGVELAVQKAYGLPSAALLMNASHTHSGPELRVRRAEDDVSSGGQPDDAGRVAQALEYSSKLQGTIVDLIGECLGRLEPAKLGYSHSRCGFAMNRRLPTGSGYNNSPYPDGPVDHAVPVLRIESASGELLAILFVYACHNTTLGLYQFNGDYAGYAQEALEAAHPGMVAMFVTGCGGDQNPYPRGTVELCQQHGKSLATAVEAALLPAPTPLSGRLSTALESVTLEFAPAADRATLEAQTQSKNRFEAGHARRVLAQLDSASGLPLEYPYLVQVIRFGDALTMVALSGEVVVDYSLRLKREHPGERIWVAGYSNDVFGYVPSRRVLTEGGYEGGGAMLYTSFPGPFAESVEERIVGKVEALLEQTRVTETK